MGRIDIRHHIATITTDNDHDCWAASIAMITRRHSTAGTDHVKSLARAANIPLDQGTLPDSSVQPLARAVRLGFHDFRTREITLREVQQLLSRGPIVAFGFFNYPGVPSALKHAVAIFSLTGDGTARGTTIRVVDPSATVNPFSDDWEHFETNIAVIDFIFSY